MHLVVMGTFILGFCSIFFTYSRVTDVCSRIMSLGLAALTLSALIYFQNTTDHYEATTLDQISGECQIDRLTLLQSILIILFSTSFILLLYELISLAMSEPPSKEEKKDKRPEPLLV